jgi:hypothetical protein
MPSQPTRQPASLADLADDLEKLGAPQGAQQMQKLAPLLDNLRAVLNRRLSAGELTYGRYLGAAEQVANSVVDNLRDVDVTLRSIRSIDANAIGERLNHLRRGGALSARAAAGDQVAGATRGTGGQAEQACRRASGAEQIGADDPGGCGDSGRQPKTEAGKTGADAEAAMAELGGWPSGPGAMPWRRRPQAHDIGWNLGDGEYGGDQTMLPALRLNLDVEAVKGTLVPQAEPGDAAALERKAQDYVDVLANIQPNADMAQTEASRRSMGRDLQAEAASAADAAAADQDLSSRGTEGGTVANALLDLKMKVEVDPARLDLSPASPAASSA